MAIMLRKSTQPPSASLTTRLLVVLLSAVALSANACATSFLPAATDYRILQSAEKFAETNQVTVALRLRAPRRQRAHHLELTVGTVCSPTQTEAMISLGPVWRLPLGAYGRRFPDLSFSPTLYSGTEFDERDIGGHIHFTSALTVGGRFGRNERISVSLRAQHTSNGGLNSDNPGLDMVGLNFTIEFRD